MKSNREFMSWYFSALLVFNGAVVSIYSLMACTSFLAAGLIMLPPLRRRAHARTHIAIPPIQRACLVLALVALATAFYFRTAAASASTFHEVKALCMHTLTLSVAQMHWQ